MDTMECLECDILRTAYRRATRKELDLMVQLDEAEIMNDSARLQELRALLGAVGVARCDGLPTASPRIGHGANADARADG